MGVIPITLLIATLVIGGMMDALVFKRRNRTISSIEDLSMRVTGGDFDAKFVPDTANEEIGRSEQFLVPAPLYCRPASKPGSLGIHRASTRYV